MIADQTPYGQLAVQTLFGAQGKLKLVKIFIQLILAAIFKLMS